MQPCRLTRPKVGRRPDAPQARQGETMLPSVSLPMAKPTSPAGDRRGRAGRRAARAGPRVPRAAGPAAEPLVAHRQRTQRQLGHQHGAGLLEPGRHGRLDVDHPVLERRRAPGRRVSGIGDQVLGSPGNAVQRTAILAGGDLRSAWAACFEREVLGERHDALQAAGRTA